MKPLLLALALCAASFAALAQDVSSACYSGREQRIKLKFQDPDANGSWRILSAGRVLASGDVKADASGIAEISFSLPELKPSVSLDAELLWGQAGAKESSRKISFFSRNPFEGKLKALEPLGIGLWSSDRSKSPAAELFKKLSLSFSTVDGISSFPGGMLFVEGMDFDNNPGVFEALKAQCSKGSHVVLLPPMKGSMKFDQPACSKILLSGDGQIKAFGSKLDAKLWGGEPFKASRFKWDLMDGSPCLRFDNAQDGFSYCEMDIGDGLLRICGWDLAAGAELSPTPLLVLEGMIDDAIRKNKEALAK